MDLTNLKISEYSKIINERDLILKNKIETANLLLEQVNHEEISNKITNKIKIIFKYLFQKEINSGNYKKTKKGGVLIDKDEYKLQGNDVMYREYRSHSYYALNFSCDRAYKYLYLIPEEKDNFEIFISELQKQLDQIKSKTQFSNINYIESEPFNSQSIEFNDYSNSFLQQKNMNLQKINIKLTRLGRCSTYMLIEDINSRYYDKTKLIDETYYISALDVITRTIEEINKIVTEINIFKNLIYQQISSSQYAKYLVLNEV
jgi:hypothetical protein